MVVEVTPLSRKDIRRIARHFRAAFGLENVRYFEIVEICEKLLYGRQLLEGFIFEVCPDEDLGEDHARTWPDALHMQVGETVYLRACAGEGRDRLTIAHELGHLILHQNVPFARKEVPAGEIPAFKSSEWQANCFGGELLVPAHLVDGAERVVDVASAFGVSQDAAKYQLTKYKEEGLVEKKRAASANAARSRPPQR